MTREEAIKALRLERGIEINGNAVRVAEFLRGLDVALSALRPITQEQVEKVWRGEWEEETYTTVSGRGRVIHSKKYTCSVCGKANRRAKTNFCPHCGASQTDEAVEMVMERLEALKDGSTTD